MPLRSKSNIFDVTIQHLLDENLPGIVELKYPVLENWTERCQIHKIKEAVEFRKGTKRYKQKLRANNVWSESERKT